MGAKKPAIIDLVGFGISTAYLCRSIIRGEYRPEQIWTCNNAHAFFKIDSDRIIAMDDLDLDRVTHPDYVEDIVSAGVPVYTSKAYPDLPNTVDYPLSEAVDFLGLRPHHAAHLLTNTLCYMLVLAAMERPKEIYLWGFDFYRQDKKKDLIAAQKKVPKGKPDWQKYYREPLVRPPMEPGADGLAFIAGLIYERDETIVVPKSPTTFLDADRPCFFYGYKDDPFM